MRSDKRKDELGGDQVFVIRVWREPGEQVQDDNAWRGHLIHHDLRVHFVGLSKLFALIARGLGLGPAVTPMHRDSPGHDE